MYRLYFETCSSLSEMWKGNPVLTAVLFGLPLGFLSLICYSICCADIMDADDEEEGNYVIAHILCSCCVNVQKLPSNFCLKQKSN